jgi:hypothetical protein
MPIDRSQLDPNGVTGTNTGGSPDSPLDNPPRKVHDKVPLPPQNITLKVDTPNHVWTLTWKDRLTSNPAQITWAITFTPDNLSGDPNVAAWRDVVYSKGTIVGTVDSIGKGQYQKFVNTVSPASLVDGYVQIAGLVDTENPAAAIPSQPMHVTWIIAAGTPPADLTISGSFTLGIGRFLGADKNQDVMSLVTHWIPPKDLSNFGGMQFYITGPEGDSSVWEVGSVVPFRGTYDSVLGIATTASPETESGLWRGTVDVVNGNNTVTLRTGPAFVGGTLNGHRYLLGYSNVGGVNDFKTNTITVVDGTHATLNGTWNGATANGVSMVVLHATTLYLVPVNKFGVRRSDPGSSPSNYVVGP